MKKQRHAKFYCNLVETLVRRSLEALDASRGISDVDFGLAESRGISSELCAYIHCATRPPARPHLLGQNSSRDSLSLSYRNLLFSAH